MRHPEKKIGPFAGGLGVAIWINRAQTGEGPKTFRSVTINPRRYYDEDSGSWKDAGSYNPTDLPALIFALQQAQAYVFQTPLPGQTIAEGEAPAPAPPDEIPFWEVDRREVVVFQENAGKAEDGERDCRVQRASLSHFLR